MPAAGFESAIPAGERQQNHALDRAATGMGIFFIKQHYFAYLTTLSISQAIKRRSRMTVWEEFGKKRFKPNWGPNPEFARRD
jgi:hypothetical protein